MLIGALFLFGCGDDDDENPMTPDSREALVRVAHLSPDAPAVAVSVDGTQVLANVSFGAFSEYLSVPAGTRRIQVRPAGQPSSAPVIDETVTIAENGRYTVAATGKVAQIGAIVLADQAATNAAAARVRFVHAGADAPPVDITLTDGTVLFSNVEFNEASGFLGTPGGSYDLQVRLAGTATVALSFGDVPLANGTIYTVFATGLVSDGTLRATVSVDAPGDGSTSVSLAPASATVRVAHLSPDAPAVDVYLDGEPVTGLAAVPFGVVSGYLAIPAATHQVQVFAAGTTTGPVIDATVTPSPGRSYTIAATGLVGDDDLVPLVIEDDRTGSGGGQARVRFVHLSPDAPAVDIVVASGPTLFDAVTFRDASAYVAVAPGTYDLEVRLDAGGALALPVSDVPLAAGANYTAFAIGLAGDGSLAALLALDTP
jgi:hypothetical protein